jgi:hypothetical protein
MVHYCKLVGQQVIDFIGKSKLSTTEIPSATTVLTLWTERVAVHHANIFTTENK